MSKAKRIESNGRIGLSKVFQEFKDKETVAVVKEPSARSSFPLRLQGLTGTISGRRGKSYIVDIKTQNKEKTFLIAPVHLKRIKD